MSFGFLDFCCVCFFISFSLLILNGHFFLDTRLFFMYFVILSFSWSGYIVADTDGVSKVYLANPMVSFLRIPICLLLDRGELFNPGESLTR